MADGFAVTVDAANLLALIDRVGPSIEFHTRDVARETAKIIADAAAVRLARETKPTATGTTERGIHWEMTYDGKGYVVMAYTKGNQPSPVDIYLESGTKFMVAEPFFFASALLEEGPHLRRMLERVQEVLDDLGR